MNYNTTARSISLCLTQDCSLRCDYCFCGDKHTKLMSKEVALKSIDWILHESKISPLVRVAFWGGEPLIRWSLIQEIVEYGNKKAKGMGKKIDWGMTTNGMHLTPEVLDSLDKLGVGYMISLDGGRETHNTHRKLPNGEGSYDIITKNIKEALKRKPDLQVRMSVSADRTDHYFEDVRSIYELGLKKVVTSPVFEGDWTEERIKAYLDGKHKFADWYMNQIRAGNYNINFKWFTDRIRSLIYMKYAKTPSAYLCGAGRTYLGIGVDGTIYPCVKPETLVHTKQGMRPIKNVQVGDYVLTHQGVYQPVTRLWQKPYDGIMYKISPYLLNIPIEFTPDHPVYAIKGQTCTRQNYFSRCKPDCSSVTKCKDKSFESYTRDWINAKDIKHKDFLVFPIDREIRSLETLEIPDQENTRKKIPSIKIDKDIMLLFGWYLAKGSTTYGSVKFALCDNEIHIAEQLNAICEDKFGFKGKITIYPENHKCDLELLSVPLSNWFKNMFGNGCSSKHIPEEFMKIDPYLQLSLIQGMFYGNGGNDRNKNAYYRTISVDLANQIKMLLLRQNVVPGIKEHLTNRHKDNGARLKEYRVYTWKTNDSAKLFPKWTFNKEKDKGHKLGWIEGDNLILAIRKINVTKYIGYVHNLEVANDNSYTLESICAHNCHRFDNFDDQREWQDKELALGHIDHGITRYDFQNKTFKTKVDLGKYSQCGACMSGCYAVNLEQTGNAHKPTTLEEIDQESWVMESMRIYNTLMEEQCTNFIRHILVRIIPMNEFGKLKWALPAGFAEDGLPNGKFINMEFIKGVLQGRSLLGRVNRMLKKPNLSNEDRNKIMDAKKQVLETLSRIDMLYNRGECKCQSK